jgi:hypothetical protein
MVVEESESEVERVRKKILADIDNAIERVATVVSDEREKRAKPTSCNRRDGWSAQYGAVIADVRDLLAAVDAARGATPELLAKLMQRVQRLSSVLELSIDCTGMSTDKMAKTVRQAAKYFLSSVHGRERNQMRRGTAKLRKARAAVMVASEAQMQRRTKHEIYKHQRNMEQVRLAGRMQRYINSALMRNEAVGLSPNLTVSVPVVDAAGEQVVDADGNLVTEKEAVIDSVQRMQHKAQRIKQWMSREGLEGERK